MELIAINKPENQVINEGDIIKPTKISNSSFIEANTKKVTLSHHKNDCTIPVFAKDNESTISHYEFINEVYNLTQNLFPIGEIKQPDIRVSHVIKGRIPSAIGKPAKELLEHEKTIFYERCAFVIEIPSINQKVNGNELTLSVGGVRSYNQENLYSKKSLEKFKLFIGFQNLVCCNMCISTDGFSDNIRVGSVSELEDKTSNLFEDFNMEKQLENMTKMSKYCLNEKEFAHLVGKMKMYQYLDKTQQMNLVPIGLSDNQINHTIRNYYTDVNFKRNDDGSINLWNLYNLFTGANKSSYIDSNFERNVNAYTLVNKLSNSIKNDTPNWFIHN